MFYGFIGYFIRSDGPLLSEFLKEKNTFQVKFFFDIWTELSHSKKELSKNLKHAESPSKKFLIPNFLQRYCSSASEITFFNLDFSILCLGYSEVTQQEIKGKSLKNVFFGKGRITKLGQTFHMQMLALLNFKKEIGSNFQSMNMAIWVVGTSNQLFKTCFYNETKFSKNIKQLLIKLRSL